MWLFCVQEHQRKLFWMGSQISTIFAHFKITFIQENKHTTNASLQCHAFWLAYPWSCIQKCRAFWGLRLHHHWGLLHEAWLHFTTNNTTLRNSREKHIEQTSGLLNLIPCHYSKEWFWTYAKNIQLHFPLHKEKYGFCCFKQCKPVLHREFSDLLVVKYFNSSVV